MKFRKKPVVIEATQWFRNGDHPEDGCYWVEEKPPDQLTVGEGKIVRFYWHPNVDGERMCGAERVGEAIKFPGAGCGYIMHDHGWIDTLEGGHVVCPGDWIITGVKGERYPCKPDIFEATYEAVE